MRPKRALVVLSNQESELGNPGLIINNLDLLLDSWALVSVIENFTEDESLNETARKSAYCSGTQ